MNFLIFLFNIFNIIYSQPCTFNTSQVTNYINKYRALHQAPNVAYDQSMASASQAWADYMANNNVFKHSNTNYGENLALFSSGQISDCTNRTSKAIDLWYNESANYSYTNTAFSNLHGHFTQTVWVNTKYISAGVAYGNKKIYVVMNFNPPGNYAGAFTKNVLPINKPSVPILSPPPIILPPHPVISSPPPVPIPPIPISYPIMSPPVPIMSSPVPIMSPPVPIMSSPVPIMSPPVPIMSPPVPIILPPHPVISLSPPPGPIILPPHPVISSPPPPPVNISKSPKPPKYLPPPPPETPKSSAKFLSPEKVIISILCILSIILDDII